MKSIARHVSSGRSTRAGAASARFLALTALVLIVVCCVLAGLGGWTRFAATPEPARDPATLPVTDARLEAGQEPERIAEGESAPRPGSEARHAVAATVDVVEAEPPKGWLVVRDVDGRELEREDGELQVRLDDESRPALVVAIRDGRFAIDGLDAGSYRIERATTSSGGEERPVVFEQDRFDHRSDVPLILHGSYLRDSTLRVVDAASGLPLDRVRVLPKLPQHAGAEQGHPGPHYPSSFWVTDAPSPVRLPRKRGVHSYWVTAAECGWSFVQVDHETGGEREVRVEPAGRLEVQVVGGDAQIAMQLRVRQHESREVAASYPWNEGGHQTFRGLAPGRYDVRVEVDAPDGTPHVLGEVPATVRARDTVTVVVELSGDAVPPLVAVTGVLVLPAAHEELDVALRIRPAEGPVFRRGDVKRIARSAMGRGQATDPLHWTADRLTPGRYLFVVEPMQYRVLIDVPLTPIDDVRIVVPELYPVTLCAIDAQTRRPIEMASLRWSRALPPELRDDDWIRIDAEPGEECASALLPLGPLSFDARSPTHGGGTMTAEVGTGTNRFTIELKPRIVCEIVLVDGSTVIPWPLGVTCDVHRPGSAQSLPCERSDAGKLLANFDEPGVYEIVVGSVEGFRPVEPVLVTIDSAAAPPIRVQLVR